MIYTHEGYEFNVEPDFDSAEILLVGPEELGYDLWLDAQDLKDEAIHKTSWAEDEYDYRDAVEYFNDSVESYIDECVNLLEKIPH
jgi:hypothetical protein